MPILKRSRRLLLLDKARAGDEEALQTILHEFVADVRHGRTGDADVRRYVGEQINQILFGCGGSLERLRKLGWPRRGRGRAPKPRGLPNFAYANQNALPQERASTSRRLAWAVALEMADGTQLTYARQHVAQQQGVSESTVRRAWKEHGAAAGYTVTTDIVARGLKATSVRALDERWGHKHVRARLKELGMLNQRDIWPTLVQWSLAGTPPEEWQAPPPPTPAKPRRRQSRSRSGK